MTPFNLEKAAYEVLLAADVHEAIPEVYAYGCRTLSGWGFPSSEGDLQERYAIIMEWLEGAERATPENLTLDHATGFLYGLAEIHAAGVLHYDLYRRNMMVIPGSDRAIWIDFSCAHLNEEYALSGEMTTARAVVMQMVCMLSFVH